MGRRREGFDGNASFEEGGGGRGADRERFLRLYGGKEEDKMRTGGRREREDMTREDKIYDVFISYRRDRGKYIARTLQQALEKYGLRVFFDMEELTDGKFNEKIYEAIEDSKNVIFLMTEGALDRCVNEGDWIRKELEHTLDCGVKLIPVAPTGTRIHFPEGLPEKLAPMKYIEVAKLNDEKLYKQSVRAIAERLQGVTLVDDAETKAAEDAFLAQARRFKRNDGRIDDEERRQLDRTARELGISNAKKILLLEKVECEYEAEGRPTESDSGPVSGKTRSRSRRKARKGEKTQPTPAVPAGDGQEEEEDAAEPKVAAAPEDTAKIADAAKKTGKSAYQLLGGLGSLLAAMATNFSKNRQEGGKAARILKTAFDIAICFSMTMFMYAVACECFATGDWFFGLLILVLVVAAHIGIHTGGGRFRTSGWIWMGIGVLMLFAFVMREDSKFWSTIVLVASFGIGVKRSGKTGQGQRK